MSAAHSGAFPNKKSGFLANILCIMGVFVAVSSQAQAYTAVTFRELYVVTGTYGSLGFPIAGGAAVAVGTESYVFWDEQGTAYPLYSPAGNTSYRFTDTDLNQQVGFYSPNQGSNISHALLANAKEGTYTDLHTANMYSSTAYGIGNGQIVGEASSADRQFSSAALWNLSTGEAVFLKPAGTYTSSRAMATNGSQQVGYAMVNNLGISHAMVWNGTAESDVDLHAGGFIKSTARGTSGTYQVGWGYTEDTTHALLWSGTPESMVDLHSAAFSRTNAWDTEGEFQVGLGILADGNNFQALLWQGTAQSVINLNKSVPYYLTNARSVSISGNTIYAVYSRGLTEYHMVAFDIVDLAAPLAGDTNNDSAVDISDYNNVINYFANSGLGDTNDDGVINITDYNAIINNFGASATAIVVPEPGSLAMLGIGAMELLRRRNRRP